MDSANKIHILEGTFLSNAENFKRTLLSVNDGVYMTDRDRRIIFWNHACEVITGYSAGEVLGYKCSDNILNHVDINGNQLCESDLCPLYQSMAKGLPGEKPFLVRALRRDKSRVTVEVSVAPLFDDERTVIGGVEIFRDVTEEQQLAEMKARFLSGITHELKTPLTIIQGVLELVLSGDTGEINQLQRDFLTSAFKEGDRFKKILDDLLDLARFEATEFSFDPQLVDLSDLLQQLADRYGGEAARKGLKLDLLISDHIVVFGDWGRLYQAFANLLSNALKYTEKGKVTVNAALLEGRALFSVRDSGIGMEEKELNRIFEHFYRIDNELTRRVGGTGIGLPIVKKIIERHGGEIAVRSVPGKGSTFTVMLPARNLT